MAADGDDGQPASNPPGWPLLSLLCVLCNRVDGNLIARWMMGDSWMIGMTEAAKLTGKQRQTIHKAIKDGRISAIRGESGEWRIDPSELFRIYPALSTVDVNQKDKVDVGLQRVDSGLQREIELFRERLREKDGIIDDLRQDRDHWRQQATALLTDQRATAPQKAAEGLLARAWSILRGKV
jgi:hypothetical protein